MKSFCSLKYLLDRANIASDMSFKISGLFSCENKNDPQYTSV